MCKKHSFLTTCMLLLVSVAFAQNIRVQGVVISADDKQPLPGVSILVKGTTEGTVSDFDGNFELQTTQGVLLQFSFIGYKTQELQATASMKVTLYSDAIEINEVVALGYTSAKKAELSSAAVVLAADALSDVTTSDLETMLQGKVAGLNISNASGQPGEAATIRIRGTGSITASSDPLYVVDGVAGGTFNVNDVESITVLKDAGATAIYGAAAAGGVIVVTTKSGKSGQGTHIDFKVTAGMNAPLFGNFRMMNSEELYYAHKQMYSKTLFNTLRPKTLLDQDFNWQDAYFSKGWTQDYYVSASGNLGKANYFASFNYYKEDGSLIGTGYDHMSGHIDLNAELFKNFRMDIRMNLEHSNTDQPYSWLVLNDAYTKMPWDNPYDENGELVTDCSDWYSQEKWNSLQGAQYNYAKSKSFGYQADANFTYQVLPWLSLNSNNRFARSMWQYTNYMDTRTYGGDYIYKSNGVSQSFGTTETIKANGQFGRHSVGGIVGFEFGTWSTETMGVTASNTLPGKDALDVFAKAQGVEGELLPEKSWSVFAQAQYDYAKRYFITASFRADASSVFPKNSRVGYFPSVAASWLMSNEEWLRHNDVLDMLKIRASYGLTGNNNIPKYKYLAYYSLSSNYQGSTGAILANMANSELRWETAYMAAVGVDVELLKGRLGMTLDLYNTDNKDLLLAVVQAPSTAFDTRLENRGSVRNQGIEFQANAVPVKVAGFQWDLGFNIAFNRNRVTELPNHESFLQTRNNVSQIVQEGEDIYSWYMPKWLGVDPKNGNPLWETILYDEAGNEIGREATSDYTKAQSQIVGKATPLFNGGLFTSFSWKGLALSVNTMFTYGNKIYNFNRARLDSDGAYMGMNQLSLENNKLGWSRWEQEGDIATHPKYVLNGNNGSNNISSRYLEDGSYFRIKNITLSYSLQPKELAKAHMTHCRFYISADNLLTATKYSGMDPEVGMSTTDYSLAGMSADQYPGSRQFLIGFEIGF